MVTDKKGHGLGMEVLEVGGGLVPLGSSLVEMTGQVLHTNPEKSWSLVGLCQEAHPSLWAEGPVGRTFQQPLFYWPHRIMQGYHALQLFRAQETGEGPKPKESMELVLR